MSVCELSLGSLDLHGSTPAVAGCKTSHNPALFVRVTAVVRTAPAAHTEFGLYDADVSPGGDWLLMSASDVMVHRTSFVSSYNADGGIAVIKNFESGNCCVALKGGVKLSVVGAAVSVVFLASASDPSFWRRSAALREFTEPMGTFSSWLRGCECHDLARQDGKLVECPLAGCRAPQMASRTAQALDELAKLRQRWVSDIDGIATAITASLASLQYKMECVHNEPCTIWQARRVGSTYCVPLTRAVLCAT